MLRLVRYLVFLINYYWTIRLFPRLDPGLSPVRSTETTNPDTTVNWSMEYKQVSIGSPSSSSDKMDVSNSNTPHSKIFTGKGQSHNNERDKKNALQCWFFLGQRKRLSESFKTELEENDNALQYDDLCIKNRSKIFRNDVTDAGYHTQDVGDFSNNSTSVFASTPSKRIAKVDYWRKCTSELVNISISKTKNK